MNKERRKEIDRLSTALGGILDTIDEVKNDIEALRDEEQDALEGLPEGLQQSEQGERMQEAVAALDEALGVMDVDLSGVLSALEEAKG